MTHSFPQDAIAALHENQNSLLFRLSKLNGSLLGRDYGDPRTKEIATHGLGRRLSFLAEAQRKIFEVTPPELEKATIPQAAEVSLLLHAHVIHIFGALDNLARVWVAEANITRADGSLIPETWLGFGPKNIAVRESLPQSIQQFLNEADEWFEYLENFRHSLAHRIPLYVPVSVVTSEDKKQADEISLELASADAALDYDRWRDAFARHTNLGQFRPVMIHSYSEGSPVMFYHGQVLNDLATIVELTQKILEALDA